MENPSPEPRKPVAEVWRPELVSLPRLTLARRIFRVLLIRFAKLLVFYMMRVHIEGMENFPRRGPALVVINHLGDADSVLLATSIPIVIDGMGKVEINDEWLAGPILRAYGMIWVHRGLPDRRAMRAALQGLAEGRIIALAPEGRESISATLEDGTEGAAFLVMKSGAPVIPVAITGTQNKYLYGRKWFERIPVTLTVGKPFNLREQPDRQGTIREGTRRIMEEIARLLPKEYRGKFDYV